MVIYRRGSGEVAVHALVEDAYRQAVAASMRGSADARGLWLEFERALVVTGEMGVAKSSATLARLVGRPLSATSSPFDIERLRLLATRVTSHRMLTTKPRAGLRLIKAGILLGGLAAVTVLEILAISNNWNTNETRFRVRHAMPGASRDERDKTASAIGKSVDRIRAEGKSSAEYVTLSERNNTMVSVAAKYKDSVPLLRLREIHDVVTRGSPLYGAKNPSPPAQNHWGMDGFTEVPEWWAASGIIPPVAMNCRGWLEPVRYSEAERLGLVTHTGAIDHARLKEINVYGLAILTSGLYP